MSSPVLRGLRWILAVLLGLLAFALGRSAIVLSLFVQPVEWSPAVVVAVAAGGLLAVALGTGALVAAVGGGARTPAFATAGVLAFFALVGLLVGEGEEPEWYRYCVLGATFPVLLAGLRHRRASAGE